MDIPVVHTAFTDNASASKWDMKTQNVKHCPSNWVINELYQETHLIMWQYYVEDIL